MHTNRLEAFSDGVLAIIITIMVLELNVPEGTSWQEIMPVIPVLLTYVISFIYIGIYWNNHHHLFHVTEKVSGGVLWCNLHLLFWLSLMPFATAWMDENGFASLPTAVYGFILLMAAVAWQMMSAQIIKTEGRQSKVAQAYRRDWKQILSISLYAAGIALSFLWPPAGIAMYVLVAVLWFMPDKRMEKVVQ